MTQQTRSRRSRMAYLKEWRMQAGLSQEALAHKAGVSVSTISRAEREPLGYSQPSVVRKIEVALGSDPYELEEPPPGTPQRDERELVDLLMALDTIGSNVDGIWALDGFVHDGEDSETALVRWLQSQPELIAKGWTLDAQRLRDSAGFLEQLADAVEAVGESSVVA